MGEVVALSLRLETVECTACGTVFAMPSGLLGRFRATGDIFYCPNGHARAYCESEVQKLQKALDAQRKRTEWAEQATKSALAVADTARRAEAIARGKLKAQSERIKAGVCPCCKRTFKQLARHMECKHPDWQKDPDQ